MSRGRHGRSAGALAPTDAEAPRGDTVQLCAFKVGTESYVLDIMRIREIINPLPVTPVRRSSPLVEGVIDLRGEVIPLVDLRRLFGIEATEATRVSKQIVASVGQRVVGLVVDAMGRVLVVSRSEIQPLPSLGDGREARVFPGVVKHQGALHLLLNLKALLDEDGISPSMVARLREHALMGAG
jgi:purine-binding chemotaxis protein CheW